MNKADIGTYRLALLGRFELTGPCGSIDIASRKAIATLAYLACATPHPQRREKLTHLLWGSHPEMQARQNLRQTLYVLRQGLGPDALISDGDYISLKPGLLACDVPRFETLIRDGSRDALAAAVDLHKGLFLTDIDIAEEDWDQWLKNERQRLHGLALDTLIKLGQLELALGKPEAAIKAADQAITTNDLREDAHRLMIQALAAGGRRPDALRHYEHLTALLKHELDVEPDAGTKALVNELRCSQSAGMEQDRSQISIAPIGNEGPPLPLPDRPSIAVLPFSNMSDDPDQEHFADGMSEDLITGLARIRWLFVIARNSTFVYKQRAVDVKQVSRELGVRYVLEGSVRRSGRQLRVSAQLIDAITGGHHWAERYDRELGDIFAVQDEITRSVAAAIEPHLLAAEGVRALSHSADDLCAWEMVARAQVHAWRLTRPDHEIAIDTLNRAVQAYPDYAPAQCLLGYCLAFAVHMGWLDRDEGLRSGRLHAVRSIALDERDPCGHIALGYLALMERRTSDAIAAFRQAVDLNPNSAMGRYHLSHGLAFAGQDREAITQADETIRLSPLDPMKALFLGAIAVAHYVAGRYEEACHFTTEAARLRPGFQGAQRMRCASLAQAGRVEEARALLATVRRDQPKLSIDWIKASVPYQTPELMEQFLEGMRKAGLNDDRPVLSGRREARR
ncbi:BTAD domain-containing putative transcriptional regulator [Bradyrhizobium prioriisuperbiae]|uniref:BTAD domain-containing putative transcriptional regulator n=1 Tax=Bradyrhizobium prioriisuperbiae TaxID=2854389 RepID=UPI0028F0595A|nr:BTAD domain-containing putative transcriptional regulator [Bradyrhizobium prioritasuperba]